MTHLIDKTALAAEIKKLKGEAEDVGVEILARCLALHTFARKDGVEWFERTTNRIIERMDKWRKDNSFVLACASVANERQKEKTK